MRSVCVREVKEVLLTYQITLTPNRQTPTCVFGQGVEHVVQEPYAR